MAGCKVRYVAVLSQINGDEIRMMEAGTYKTSKDPDLLKAIRRQYPKKDWNIKTVLAFRHLEFSPLFIGWDDNLQRQRETNTKIPGSFIPERRKEYYLNQNMRNKHGSYDKVIFTNRHTEAPFKGGRPEVFYTAELIDELQIQPEKFLIHVFDIGLYPDGTVDFREEVEE